MCFFSGEGPLGILQEVHRDTSVECQEVEHTRDGGEEVGDVFRVEIIGSN